MKKSIITCCVAILMFSSCSKEEQETFEITDATYRVLGINDTECAGVNNGSTIQVRLSLKIQDAVVEKMISQYMTESGEGGKDDYIIDAAQIESEKLNYSWCYRFDDDDWVEEKFKLVGMTMMGAPIESNQVTLRIDRPAGAN